MGAIKYMKIDLRFLKVQKVVLILFPILAVFMEAFGKMDFAFVFGYLCFGAIIIAPTAFMYEQKGSDLFIAMLPGKLKDRVWGRFLNLIILMLGAFLCAMISHFIAEGFSFSISGMEAVFMLAAFCISIMIGSIQMLVFYKVGREKSQQWLAMFRLIPGFVVFFGITYASDALIKEPDLLKNLVGILQRQAVMLGGLLVVICIAVLLVCEMLSVKICSKKDGY
ncbi:MAG: ABC-2 transporter permease [Lachnospiraceae bacterium]|nr:ABC-2 transporter permease [Lachnospiraceae bacterium]MDD3615398.1 ABC-2 transporter permease [Lachnospiraceae bacterium]